MTNKKIIESDCGNVTILAGDDIPNKIFIDDAAKNQIEKLCKDEGDNSFLRIAVMGGGCSGFQYLFGFDNELDDNDIINDWGSGRVVVDNISMQFIKGSTLHFLNDFNGEYFQIENSLAKSQCGCGNSFSMDM